MLHLFLLSRHSSDSTIATSIPPLCQYPASCCFSYPTLAPSSTSAVPCWSSFPAWLYSPCMTRFNSLCLTWFYFPCKDLFESLCVTWFYLPFMAWFDSLFPTRFDLRFWLDLTKTIRFNFTHVWRIYFRFESYHLIPIIVKPQWVPHWPGCLWNNPTSKLWNIPRFWELKLVLVRTL